MRREVNPGAACIWWPRTTELQFSGFDKSDVLLNWSSVDLIRAMCH